MNDSRKECRTSETADNESVVLMEHRQGMRRCALALVEVHGRDHSKESGLMYNISRHGMFILSNARVRVNECVEIVIPVTGKSEPLLRIPAMAVHRRDNGFGIMFRWLDEQLASFVEKCFRHYAEVQQSSGRESDGRPEQRCVVIGEKHG